jgi:hypothetical protein
MSFQRACKLREGDAIGTLLDNERTTIMRMACVLTTHYTLHTAHFTHSHDTRHTSHHTHSHHTLHTTHYTLHTTHYTPHTTHYTLHTFTPHTSHHTLHITHFTLHTTHYALHTPHPGRRTPYTLNPIPQTPRCEERPRRDGPSYTRPR